MNMADMANRTNTEFVYISELHMCVTDLIFLILLLRVDIRAS